MPLGSGGGAQPVPGRLGAAEGVGLPLELYEELTGGDPRGGRDARGGSGAERGPCARPRKRVRRGLGAQRAQDEVGRRRRDHEQEEEPEERPALPREPLGQGRVEGVAQLPRVGEALLGVARQRLLSEGAEGRADLGPAGAEGRRAALLQLEVGLEGRRGVVCEGRRAAHHLMEHDPQGPHVGRRAARRAPARGPCGSGSRGRRRSASGGRRLRVARCRSRSRAGCLRCPRSRSLA